MFKYNESDRNKHYEGENFQWISFAVLSLILSIGSLSVFLVIRPEMTSTASITLFIIQIAAALIVRLTFFARRKHENMAAIILVSISTLVIATFIIVFVTTCILPVFKEYTDIYKP